MRPFSVMVAALFATLLRTPLVVHAQADVSPYLANISIQCQSTLLVLNSDSSFEACVPISNFIPIISDTTINTQTVSDVQFALGSICSKPKCGSDVISKAAGTVMTGCAAEIQAGTFLPDLLYYGLEWYSAIYDAGCLKNSAGDLCVIETLKNVAAANATGTLNLSSVSSLNASLVCTVCNKNIFNIIANFAQANPQALPPTAGGTNVASFLSSTNTTLSGKCGVPFLDGVTNATSLVPNNTTGVENGNNNGNSKPASVGAGSRGTEVKSSIAALAIVVVAALVL